MAEKKEQVLPKLKKLFFHPKAFFSEVEKEKNYSSSLFFYAKLSIAAAIIGLLLSIITLIIKGVNGSLAISIANLLTSLIFSIGAAFAIPFIAAGITHLAVLVFGGRQGFFNTYKPITYALSITIIYSLIIQIISWIFSIIDSSLAIATENPELLLQNQGFIAMMIIYLIVMTISTIHMIYTGTLGLSKFQKMGKLKAFISIIIIPLIITIITLGLIFYVFTQTTAIS